MKKILLLFASVMLFSWQVNAQNCASPTPISDGVALTGQTTCGTATQLFNNPCNGVYVANTAAEEAHIYSYTTGAFPEDITVDYSNLTSAWSGVTIVSGTCDDPSATCLGSYFTGGGTASGTAAATLVPAATTIYIYVSPWPTPNCVATYDLLLSATPVTCPAPTAPTANVLSADSAILSWTTGGSTEWLLEFGVAGFTPGSGTLITGAAIDTMSGLLADTDYEWYVRDYCAPGDSSDWVGPNSFTTLSTCPVPSAFATTFVGGDSVELSWTTGGTTEWILEYGPAGYTPGSGTQTATTSNPASITGLASATAYDAYVRDYCGPGDSSLWVGPVSFSTPILPLACTAGGGTVLFTEDFETDVTVGPGGSSGTVGPWTQVRNTDPDWTWDGAGGTPSSPTGPSAAFNGTGFVYLETSGAAQDADTLTSGLYDLSTANAPARLRFYYHMFGADIGTMTVETSDDGGATWNPGVAFVGEQQTSSADAWKEAAIDISYAVGSSNFQVRFVGDKNNSPTGVNFFYGDMAVDFIRIEACVTCPAPSAFVVDAVGSDTAQISWTTGGSTEWIVQYGPAGFTPGTGTIVTTTSNPYTITGLMELTAYEVYVKDYCAVGDSSLWTGPISFRTELTPLSCPSGTGAPFNIFETSFEGNPSCTGTFSTVDWNGFLGFTNTNTLGGTFNGANWRIDCGGPTSNGWVDVGPLDGSSYAYFESSNAGVGGDPIADTLTTPDFDISTLQGAARVTANFVNGGNSTFIVERSTDAGATWTNVFTDNGLGGNANPDPGEWTLIADDISSFLGVATTVTYRFIGVCTNNSGDMALDLLILESCVSCVPPSAVTATVISADSAQIDFTPFSQAQSVIVEYGIAGFTPGTGTVETTTADSLILSGLMSASDYEYYIGSDCSASTGDSSILDGPFTFTTPCVTFVAPYFENFDASLSTPLCWDNSFGTEPWSFQVSGGPGPDYLVLGAVDHTSGSGNFAWIDGSGNIGTNELVSPFIDFSALNFPVVGYWILSNSNDGAQNTIELSYWDGAAWVLLNTYGGNDVNWIEVSDTIPAGVPSPTQFKLVQVGSTTGTGSQFNNDLLVDDFFVYEAPTCPGVSNIALDSVATDIAVVSWDENGGATEWFVEAVPAGSAPSVGVLTSMNPFTFTGLSSNTEYNYFITSYCGPADTSFVFNGGSFTTLPECGDTVGNLIYNLTNTAQVLLSFQGTPGDFVTLEFLAGQVETCCDEVLVYDGLNGTGNILYGSLTGGGLANYSGEGTIESTTGQISLVVNSDVSVTGASAGFTPFQVVVECVPPPVSELGVSAITAPVSGCGQEFTPVSIVVENFGYATVFYAPVVVQVTGDIMEEYTFVLDSIPSLSTDTFVLDSINTLAGGDVTITAFTNLANDEDTSNDTTVVDVSFGEIPPAPAFTNLMACEGEELVLTAANLGQLNWFTSDTATTPVFVGDTILWTATNDTSFYVSQQETSSDTVTLQLFDSDGDGWTGGSLNVFVNNVPVPGSPFTLATGSTGTETFFVNHNDFVSFLYTTGSFATEPAYNLVLSDGTIVFNDGGGFGGPNTTPTGGFNQNIQIAGCPSELTLFEISVGQNYLDSIDVTACDSMMIAGVNVTTSGTYTDSLTSVGGCDSIVVIDLTINNSSSALEEVKLCSGSPFTLADGTVVTTGGTFTATVPNAAGCDSVITYDITEGANTSFTQNVQLCDGDTVVVGLSSYTTSGTYVDVLENAAACDSVVTTNVFVLPASNVTIGGVTTVCDNAGVIDLNLSPAGGTLSGPGVTGNSFDPAAAGVGSQTLTYTFVGTSGCTASASLDVEVVVCTGIEDIEGIETISIYPNPYTSVINMMFDDASSSELTIKLLDVTGRVLMTETVNTTIGANSISLEVPVEVAAGVTIMQVERDGAIYSTTLIKK